MKRYVSLIQQPQRVIEIYFTFSGLLFLKLLLLVLNGFYLCVVDLCKLVPVGPVVVQAIKHGLDLFVEPGELLIKKEQERP